MKWTISGLLGWLIPVIIAVGVEMEDQRTVLTINSNGSCQLTYETLKPRAMAERQMRAWQRSENGRENTGQKSNYAQANPFTDEELAQVIRARTRANNLLVGPDETIEVLEITPNLVRKVTSRSYATLPEMVSHAYGIWAQAGLAFENIRFENDREGHLLITHLPGPGMEGYTSSWRGQWKRLGFKSDFKLVLPGKVLSSGLGAIQDNATWITIDSRQDETVQAALKLFRGPMLITSELGGLEIGRPLESKTLREQALHGGSASAELPILEAGSEFLAEPLTLTTRRVHVFPEGAKRFGQKSYADPGGPAVTIRAKLFAPKERTFQSISGARVIKATDDQGRPIATGPNAAMGDPIDYNSRNSRQSNSIEFQLHLPLPQPDAHAIEDLTAEVEAVTTGTWKQLTLTDFPENASRWIDLSSILPGTSLNVTKVEKESEPLNIEVTIKGPPAIRQLELQLQAKGNDRFLNPALMT